MSLGVYIHIPYCIQRCTYCDFATFVQDQIAPPEVYVRSLLVELARHKKFFPQQQLKSLYFGGGTPSLIPADLIIAIKQALASYGFTTGPDTEVTLEMNPATVSEKKLEQYLSAGFNRFSVGAQTFNDKHLKSVHREHNSQQTRDTLSLLRKYDLNFSFDLLFGLPHQTIDEVKEDLKELSQIGASHVSPYCLTVPEGHPLSKNRAQDEDQVEMFELIQGELLNLGYHQYEISNFAKPGFESRHNLLYWTDENFWGLGLSAHSYRRSPDWGIRFWNQNNFKTYLSQYSPDESPAHLDFVIPETALPEAQFEMLKKHQSLTDFLYTSLRTMRGLSKAQLQQKFGAISSLDSSLANLEAHGLIENNQDFWRLTNKGIMLSNQVFEKLTFLESEV